MGRMTVTGLDDFSARIGKLGSASAGMIRQSMYDGAAQMKAAYEAEILALPAAEHHPLKEGELMTGITDTNRQDLLNGLYVRKFATEGGQHYTVIGFNGYGSPETATKRYPNGLPNALLARSINSGSSVRRKNRFAARAKTRSQEAAKAAMAETFSRLTDEIMKG